MLFSFESGGISAKKARELLRCQDGFLYWRKGARPKRVEGKRAGTLHNGRLQTYIHGKLYRNSYLIDLIQGK